jgi:hypothetical protein
VAVAALQQATVEPGQPPAPPEPMSDEERALWATEGEMPELAPPTAMDVNVWCGLSGPAGNLASRHPDTALDAMVESPIAAQVLVESPSGESVILPSYGDIYGQGKRFHGRIQELPQAGGTYTFTALDADGAPIPGAVASDVYVGGYELDPPTHIQAEVVEDGILVTWEPSPAIPGAFDPGKSPPRGFYQMTLAGEGMEFGWNSVGMPLPETSHLIPLRRQDFGPGDRGLALEEMDDGVYNLWVVAYSVAPEGTAGRDLECEAHDPVEDIQIVIEGGQARVEGP